jgi:folate-dependent phosphoribosylglycinamide formyltransferase PurN
MNLPVHASQETFQMADLTKDTWLNQYLKGLRLADHVYSDETIRWGEFIEPNSDPRPIPKKETLRLAVIASLPGGFLTLKTLLAYANSFPEKLHIVCLLTDDPGNPDARISVKKRIWHHHSDMERRQIEQETVKTALEAGIPVYTGDIKQDWFRSILSELLPHAVLCNGFGQLVDRPFLQIPELGVYNFHPSDLAQGFGAGPAPYEESRSRDAKTTCWTVHLMNEAIDDGHIVGSSPPINIRHADGTFPADPTDYYSKIADGLDHLVFHAVDRLIEWHESGQTVPMSKIEFERLFTDKIKARMLEPIRDFPEYLFPDPSLFSTTNEG